MTAAAHFMTHRYGGFNAPITILPPTLGRLSERTVGRATVATRLARATTFDSMICVAIVTATSSGVRAPIWTPIGAWSRARSASPTPASRSLCSRSVRVFSLPIAPM